MQSIQETFQKIQNLPQIFSKKVFCLPKDSEEIDITNPQFAQMDPHLKYDDSDEIKQEEERLPPHMRGASRRPPQFEALLNNVRSITKKVEHIKGFKFEVSPGLSPNFNIAASWIIPEKAGPAQPNPQQMMMGRPPKENPSHFGLNLQYVGGNIQQLMQGHHPSFIMTGRWESTGKLQCAVIKKVRDNIQCRVSAGFPQGSELQAAEVYADVDIEGEDYLHTLRYGTNMYSFNHMQSIGKNLILGYELMNIIPKNAFFTNFAGKYTYKRRHQFFGNYTAPSDTLTTAYLLTLKKGIHLVSELEVNMMEGKTTTTLGYQQRFPSSEVVSTINSKGKISTSLNILGPMYSLKLCAQADYLKDVYKFGYGFSFGQQQ